MDFQERVGCHTRVVGKDLFEQLPYLQIVCIPLVVVDVATGERGLIQMPDEHLLAQRETLKAIGIQLDDRRIIDTLEEIPAL